MNFLYDIDEVVVFKKIEPTFTNNKNLINQWNMLEDGTTCVINSRRHLSYAGNVYHVTVVNGKIPYTYILENQLERLVTFNIKKDIDDLLK